MKLVTQILAAAGTIILAIHIFQGQIVGFRSFDANDATAFAALAIAWRLAFSGEA